MEEYYSRPPMLVSAGLGWAPPTLVGIETDRLRRAAARNPRMTSVITFIQENHWNKKYGKKWNIDDFHDPSL